MTWGMMESNQTVELRYLVADPNFDLFDFPYDFYDENLKTIFEELFIQHYFFYEIGCEVLGRWKAMLQAHLNLVMPYYRQLYKTELESENINFLLNKDLKETFTREVNEDNSEKENINANNSTVNKVGSDSNTNFYESALDNGIASINDSDKYTTVNRTTGENNINSNKTDTTQNDRIKDTLNKVLEKTELVSQGNIGITSSAELLDKWRASIININEMLINSCSDLFMLVYN